MIKYILKLTKTNLCNVSINTSSLLLGLIVLIVLYSCTSKADDIINTADNKSIIDITYSWCVHINYIVSDIINFVIYKFYNVINTLGFG